MFHVIYDSEELFIVDIIIDFSGNTLLGSVDNGMPLLVIIELAKNARDSEIRCVSVRIPDTSGGGL